VTFSLLQSTYLVSGKPLFVAGYAINAEVTTAVRPLPEVSIDVTWVAGALSTSKLPLATLSIAVSTPAVETAYGSWSGGGSVGFTTPDAVYMFLDQNERNKLLAALKNPAQGPAYVLQMANMAISELKTMVTNPAYDAGISVGLPGTSAFKLKPDGGMVLSLGGVIASF
jgi:multidrug transporter EmrE-like cation transporter